MEDRTHFYLARLIDANGDRLASETIWIESLTSPNSTPERVALDAAAFFNTDSFGEDPAGCTIELYGPFAVTSPAYRFKIEDDESEGAKDFWTATDLNGAPAYLATFKGQAWIMGNSMQVDDSTFTYEVTAREVAELCAGFNDAPADYDGLMQAAGAPAVVREWSGPFDIYLSPLGDLPGVDVAVIDRDSLDEEHAANFESPWLVQYADGTVIEFADEDTACAFQRMHRNAVGLDEETGEPS